MQDRRQFEGETSDRVAVIGAGIVGLATARALRRGGYEVSVFEHGAPGGGQSAGESRIFRHSHGDERQFELALKARRDWQEWEADFGVQLISPDGSMVIGEEGVSRLLRYADDPSIEVDELDPEGVAECLPILSGFDGPAMIDRTAGAIRTRLALANLIRETGTGLIPDRVESVLPFKGGGVEVISTMGGTQTFSAAVVCAGMGTASLAAGAGIDIPVSTEAHVRVTLPLGGNGHENRLACLQDSSGAFGEAAAYGSPVRGNREYSVGLPIATEVASEAGSRSLIDLADRTHAYLFHAFPGLDPQPATVLHCWVTELPWAADGLAVWQSGDAYFIAGHNLFKLAPALGKMLARSVSAGEVEGGFRPLDRLGEPMAEPAGSTTR